MLDQKPNKREATKTTNSNKKARVVEFPDLFPNLIDGAFLDVKDPEEKEEESQNPQIETHKTDQKTQETQTETIKKKIGKKPPKLPELYIPEPPTQIDDDKSFICPDCEAEFNRKFKRNRHVYIAHKKTSDQLEEIIKTAEKQGHDQAAANNSCCCPMIVIYID